VLELPVANQKKRALFMTGVVLMRNKIWIGKESEELKVAGLMKE
jgi:hypothetical protein